MLKAWDEDTDPLEIKFDIYGLGRYDGSRRGEDNDLVIPYSLLKQLSDRFSITTDSLLKTYVKGLMDGMKDTGSVKKDNTK